eukprot:COSAG01_NODE_19299_length_1018_cov_2.323177_1_plen_106_part_10
MLKHLELPRQQGLHRRIAQGRQLLQRIHPHVDLFFESGGDIAAPPHSTAAGAATTTRGGESAAAAAGLSGVVGRPALSRGAAAPSFEDGLQPAPDAHSDGNVSEVG